MFWLFALTPHVERETAFKRISQIKQVLDLRQGGAAAHGSTNSIILYFSQDLRSPDQFSASKQTQPVHLQHHPTCHSNMSLQHVTPTCHYSITDLSCYSRLPSFSYSEGNRRWFCSILLKKLYVSRSSNIQW